MELATRCFPCTALARRAEEYRDSKYPQALRFVVGLREKGAALLAARREAADHDDIPEE